MVSYRIPFRDRTARRAFDSTWIRLSKFPPNLWLRSPRLVHELNARERNSGQLERPWRPRIRRSYGTREPQSACPGRFIIFFLFKCHFVACSAVYKTECVPRGSRVSYHLSSFVAYKHNSTRSLTRFILCLRIRSWHMGARPERGWNRSSSA